MTSEKVMPAHDLIAECGQVSTPGHLLNAYFSTPHQRSPWVSLCPLHVSHTHTHARTHTHAHARTHTRTHAHARTHAHTHTHTHTHTANTEGALRHQWGTVDWQGSLDSGQFGTVWNEEEFLRMVSTVSFWPFR